MAADSIVVTGRVTADVEVKKTRKGKSFVRFCVANTPRRFDEAQHQWVDAGDTVFMDCVAWDVLAECLPSRIRKGSRVIVVGMLKSSSWEGDDGGKRHRLEVRANDVAVSVRDGVKRAAGAAGRGVLGDEWARDSEF